MTKAQENLKQLGLSNTIELSNLIGPAASSSNLRSYLCGGIVRDALLNRPSKDVDICVAGDPKTMQQTGEWIYSQLSNKRKVKYETDVRAAGYDDLKDFFRNCGGGVLLAFILYLQGKTEIAPVIYPRFLVAMTKIGGEDVELTATRAEDYSQTEGQGSRERNPGKVDVADEYEDAIRRDFTMNALYVNLATGELLDPTRKGLQDIKNRIIRVTRSDDPKQVFLEDPLRIIRAIRQSAQLGFTIEPKTEKIIADLVQKNGKKYFSLDKKTAVSAERIRDEFLKILISKRPVEGLQKMLELGVLDVTIPALAELARDPSYKSKNLWEHTMVVLQNAQITPEIETAIEETAERLDMPVDSLRTATTIRLKLGALFHDIGKMAARSYGRVVCPFCHKTTDIKDIKNPKCYYCKKKIDIQRSQKDLQNALSDVNKQIQAYFEQAKAKYPDLDLDDTTSGGVAEKQTIETILSDPTYLQLQEYKAKVIKRLKELNQTSFNYHEAISERTVTKILSDLRVSKQMVNWVARDCALHQVQFDNYLGEDLSQVDPTTGKPMKTTQVEKLYQHLIDRNISAPDEWDQLNFAVRLFGLIRADSSANPQAQQDRVNQFIDEYQQAKEMRQTEEEWKNLNKPILSGHELMQMFNSPAGTWIGEINKKLIEDRLANPQQHTKARAMQIAQNEWQKMNIPTLSESEIISMFNLRPGAWVGAIQRKILQSKLTWQPEQTKEDAIKIAQEELAKWGPEIYVNTIK